MKQFKYILKRILLVIFTVVVCTSAKKSVLSIDVKEVDYADKASFVLEGKPLDLPVMGANNMVITDSILAFTTNDVSGMLQVFSLNSMNQIGKFCTKGRAGNEFLQLSLKNCVVKRNGNILLPMTNYPGYELKLVNVSESLRKGYTVIDDITDNFFEGSFVLLDNKSENRFEYHLQEDPDGNNRGVPVYYSIRNGKKTNKVEVFSKPVKYDNKEADYVAPYMGALYKHPNRNLVIETLMYTDYLLFFDIDYSKYFAIHRENAESYDDVFSYQKTDYKTFTDIAVTDDFFMILYWGGKNNIFSNANNVKPELLMFDWNGNFIRSAKLDQTVNVIEYDNQHKLLYGLNRDNESIYTFDVKQMVE